PKCEACDLDFSFADPADGPAFFVICIACIPVIAIAAWIEISFEPPFWVHMVTSFPITLLACLLPLRPMKGWFVNSQFFFKAAEGQIDRDYVRPKRPMSASEAG